MITEAGSSPFSLGEDVVAQCPTEGCLCWWGAVTISIITQGFLGLEGCNLRDRVRLNSLKVGLGGLWRAALTLILTTCSVAVDTHLGVPASSAFSEYLTVWAGRNPVPVPRGWDWGWGRGLGLCYLLIVEMLESDADGRAFRAISLVSTNAITLLISLVRISFVPSSSLRLSGSETPFNSKSQITWSV